MNEQKHFKNALITFYRRGMRIIKDYGGTGTIVAVAGNGNAIYRRDVCPEYLFDLNLSDINDYELDLGPDSIWEDRVYYGRRCNTSRATIRCVSGDYIGYSVRPANTTELTLMHNRDEFLAAYSPVPIVTIQDVVAPPWTPTAGKQADWIVAGRYVGTFEVLHLRHGWAMLWDGTDAHACEESELVCPRPPEDGK